MVPVFVERATGPNAATCAPATGLSWGWRWAKTPHHRFYLFTVRNVRPWPKPWTGLQVLVGVANSAITFGFWLCLSVRWSNPLIEFIKLIIESSPELLYLRFLSSILFTNRLSLFLRRRTSTRVVSHNLSSNISPYQGLAKTFLYLFTFIIYCTRGIRSSALF